MMFVRVFWQDWLLINESQLMTFLNWGYDAEIQLVPGTNDKHWLFSHLANLANFSKEQELRLCGYLLLNKSLRIWQFKFCDTENLLMSTCGKKLGC